MSCLQIEMTCPFLDVQDSNAGPRTVPLETDVTRLGRLSTNTIQLLEPHVSKRHAEIREQGNQFVIVDLESKAGVLVNGVRVNERRLEDGDLITFGVAPLPTMVFRREESATAQPTAPVPRAPAVPPAGADSFSSSGLFQTISLADGGQGLGKLARFLEFTRLLGKQFSLAEVLENVVDLAIDLTAAERGFLILQKPDDTLDYRVARGKGKLPLPEEETRASETIVREVLKTGSPRVVSDVQQDEALAEMWSVGFFNLRSAVALPLKRIALSEEESPRSRVDGGIFGVLYLDSQMTQARFDRIDRDILESLARDASSAIENARLLRQADEKRKMDEEMERAREIQAALLPESFRGEPHFDVSGYYVPSRRLGGDYMDQIRLPDGRSCLVIADVSGKGLPAALLAAGLQGAMSAEGFREQPLGAMVERLNRAICRRVPEGKYVTFFCCVLSPDGVLTYVNAGHVPPIVITDGAARQLFTGDMAVGIMGSSTYREGTLTLRAGDVVALYTDGVTEAVSPEGLFFEETRLEKILQDTARRPVGEIVQKVTDAVWSFTDNAPPQDDITLLVLKYRVAGTGAS